MYSRIGRGECTCTHDPEGEGVELLDEYFSRHVGVGGDEGRGGALVKPEGER